MTKDKMYKKQSFKSNLFDSKIIAYFILTVTLVTLGSLTVHAEQRFVKQIKDGLYQNYSGQPLVDLGGKYYYFEVTLESTWDEANVFCRNLGLFLVSVEDATENELIKNHIQANIGYKQYWTSGTDFTDENSWVWSSTGQPVIFTDWHKGEPNNTLGIENFIEFSFDKAGLIAWNDCPVDEPRVYACCEQEI